MLLCVRCCVFSPRLCFPPRHSHARTHAHLAPARTSGLVVLVVVVVVVVVLLLLLLPFLRSASLLSSSGWLVSHASSRVTRRPSYHHHHVELSPLGSCEARRHGRREVSTELASQGPLAAKPCSGQRCGQAPQHKSLRPRLAGRSRCHANESESDASQRECVFVFVRTLWSLHSRHWVSCSVLALPVCLSPPETAA